MKKALVLAGGGTKGIYECGVLKAMKELGKDDWDLVIGVSVGALNAAMLVQNDFDLLEEMYMNLQPEQIINGFVPDDMSVRNIISERAEFLPSLKYYIREKGIDIRPFYDFVDRYYNPEKLQSSRIDFRCITAKEKDHSCVYVNKEMMKENGRDWLIASASAYPAFPVKEIHGEGYIDGGYYDNFPIETAIRQGAQEITGIELNPVSIHPGLLGRDHITIVRPHEELESFLSFDQELMVHRKRIGYNDAMKKFGRYVGERYTFQPFVLPDFFASWYLNVIVLEAKIKNASGLNERFYSRQLITDKIKDQLHLPYLNSRHYFYAMMDLLMESCGADAEEVFTIEDALKRIADTYRDSVRESFELFPSHITEYISYFKGLDRTARIRDLLHVLAWPEHRFLADSVVLSLFPMDTALAMFAAGILHITYEV